MDNNIQEESEAFDRRIRERVEAGYIPDLRRAVMCDYFYQSYWRDPHFADLFVGESTRIFLSLIAKHHSQAKTILDAGCGPGYMTLEFARAGYAVTGIDISASSIEIAQQTLAENPYKDDFGSLEYHTMPLDEVRGSYDVVIFSGVLHHFENPEQAIIQSKNLLAPGGIVISHEPSRDKWGKSSASQTALIRLLLTLTGVWYDQPEDEAVYTDDKALKHYIDDLFIEFTEERDKREGHQSPHDNDSDSAVILAALNAHLDELEYRHGFSYLYRMLGGMRGEAEKIHLIADFLATYEQFALREGFIDPITFFHVGKLPN